jgi:hypothetical protein
MRTSRITIYRGYVQTSASVIRAGFEHARHRTRGVGYQYHWPACLGEHRPRAHPAPFWTGSAHAPRRHAGLLLPRATRIADPTGPPRPCRTLASRRRASRAVYAVLGRLLTRASPRFHLLRATSEQRPQIALPHPRLARVLTKYPRIPLKYAYLLTTSPLHSPFAHSCPTPHRRHWSGACVSCQTVRGSRLLDVSRLRRIRFLIMIRHSIRGWVSRRGACSALWAFSTPRVSLPDNQPPFCRL